MNGLAAKCDFGEQTKVLVHDISILNMANEQVREKLRTESKEKPAEVLQFAIAYEDGLRRQNVLEEITIKKEPVNAVSGNTGGSTKILATEVETPMECNSLTRTSMTRN